ncbi:hypothetical protein CDAR_557871 [Caerostris darwini]|uniref:CUB domain-containing protein n=1 Tax=Caerostris darwini TaxID=1538125 RepID=A0AAV4RD06_9ARAC|nr:hypothetical protein CDAR_557871 [Caerostris darwini]
MTLRRVIESPTSFILLFTRLCPANELTGSPSLQSRWVLWLEKYSKCIFEFHSHQSAQGNFSSPLFPGNYSESLECVYNFQGKEHETLRLTFHEFQLEQPFVKGCLTDYIDVSTITIIGNKFLVGRYCGDTIPGSMLFMNPHAEIIFKTNLVVHGKGFHGSYHFQDESECFLLFQTYAVLALRTKD